MSLEIQVRYFLGEYLPQEKKSSPNTILAYGDTFRLLTNFLERRMGRRAGELGTSDLSGPIILEFLENLERERGYQACSINARLTAIRSFLRMLAARGIDHQIDPAVFSIPVKRADRRTIRFLTPEEMEAIIAGPDRSEWSGRRDHALLLTMYNTGAKLSEITALRRDSVRFDGPPSALLGRGRATERVVPLWLRTMQTLERWFRELEAGTDIVFPSTRGGRLSSDGVYYILRQAVRRATPGCASLASGTITPHVIRHTAAVHFLRAGIEGRVVAKWLGHRSPDAIRIYRDASEPAETKVAKAQAAAGA